MDGSSIQGETFEDKLASIACLLANKKNIVVLAGAGISVSCGIPDFRSTTGLYNTLNYQELALASPEDLFDIETFREDPRPFYKFAHQLWPAQGSIQPGASHKFLAWLDQQKMLLRIYTQNIDTLEQSAGVRSDKVVYAHGSLLGATCMKCKAKYLASDIAADVQSGTVPLCKRSRNKKTKLSSGSGSTAKKTSTMAPPLEPRMSLRRASAKRVPSQSDMNFEVSMKQGLCCGVIKPNVTFFGEKLGNDVGRSLEKDYESADALIVMGTSLSVAPMSKVVGFLPPDIPRFLINRNIVRLPKVSGEDDEHLFHVCLLGNCDDVVKTLEQKMKGKDSQTESTNIDHKGSVANSEAWLRNQPKESVLLFPGAVVCEPQEPEPAEPQQKVVVYCDECENEIEGKIFCCGTCFDYDLCGACYPNTSLTHADGKHDFVVES
mmetsp:Transcript_43283/g.79209  ORF Transcript_43283/g.79209 Transcript_43283/m.79209 type:complete len:435 (-) Transcript_43283:366-1670(-)